MEFDKLTADKIMADQMKQNELNKMKFDKDNVTGGPAKPGTGGPMDIAKQHMDIAKQQYDKDIDAKRTYEKIMADQMRQMEQIKRPSRAGFADRAASQALTKPGFMKFGGSRRRKRTMKR